MDRGGITTFLMNCYKYIDRKQIEMDFAVMGKGMGERDNEITETGGKIYNITPKSVNLLKHVHEMKKVLQNGHYTIIHANCDAGNALVLKMAKKCGIPVRISHSHNTDFLTNNQLRLLANKLQRMLITKYATTLWACSSEAGKWLYGNDFDFEIIHNAFELKKYEYSEELRCKIRKQYSIENQYVIGNIGRLDYQKNQSFLIKTFYELNKKKSDFLLMLVGDGVDKQKLEGQVESLGLKGKVVFTGQADNVNEILNAFDVFVLPSHFEGLSIALIEAQTNGLYCITSTTVPQSSDVTSRVLYLPLEKDPEIWVENIMNMRDREPGAINDVRKAGYDILVESKYIQKQYIELAQKYCSTK